jgi:ankyrin repeat protein
VNRGGDPTTAGWDGRSAYRMAIRRGRPDVAALLLQYGAGDDGADVDRFLDACLRADRATARQLIEDHPGLLDRLSDEDHGVLVRAADYGDVASVRLMLDLGFPPGVHAGVDGATALHAAAGSGSAEVVRLLVEAGTPIEGAWVGGKPPSPEVAEVLAGHGIGPDEE